MTTRFLTIVSLLAAGLGACTQPHPPTPTESAGTTGHGATASSSPSVATTSPPVVASASSPAAPHPSASSPSPEALRRELATIASVVSAVAEEAVPDVEVKNIGMHIGGGPNERESKAPIAKSVRPHFDEFRACWRYAENPERGGTFGVDLLIPREGGKATISHPRSGIDGEKFEKCVLDVFRQIEFLRPRTGKTMVSYSLRFTPKKRR